MENFKIWPLHQRTCASSILVLMLVSLVPPTGHAREQDRRPTPDDLEALARIDDVFFLIRANFVESVAPQKLADAAVGGSYWVLSGQRSLQAAAASVEQRAE